MKYKSYWRKSGLKAHWGKVYLNHLKKYKPKNFLEIGVFCGVTARNTCDYLSKEHNNEFSYIGVDFFGEENLDKSSTDEIKPSFLKKHRFSNPLKNIYYNFIKRENINSLESVTKFLKKYEQNVKLVQGDTNTVLKNLDLSKIDYAFVDGGHSYNTVLNDLNLLYQKLGSNKVLLCDDYGGEHIPEVQKAINEFVKSKNLKINLIENRFAEIIT
ncbi:MAG: methyltransferase [Pelagibacteraceae bacterium TMED287]|nr:MAG: methyltransferase [Pelagibacteraceae bacterium TMED287]